LILAAAAASEPDSGNQGILPYISGNTLIYSPEKWRYTFIKWSGIFRMPLTEKLKIRPFISNNFGDEKEFYYETRKLRINVDRGTGNPSFWQYPDSRTGKSFGKKYPGV
jgi:hypothetical protein